MPPISSGFRFPGFCSALCFFPFPITAITGSSTTPPSRERLHRNVNGPI